MLHGLLVNLWNLRHLKQRPWFSFCISNWTSTNFIYASLVCILGDAPWWCFLTNLQILVISTCTPNISGLTLAGEWCIVMDILRFTLRTWFVFVYVFYRSLLLLSLWTRPPCPALNLLISAFMRFVSSTPGGRPQSIWRSEGVTHLQNSAPFSSSSFDQLNLFELNFSQKFSLVTLCCSWSRQKLALYFWRIMSILTLQPSSPSVLQITWCTVESEVERGNF